MHKPGTDKEKIRLVVLTDISSLKKGYKEPDDTQSLVRLLLYANQFDIEGLIATYSSHWKDEGGVKPEYIEAIVREYGKVRDNLLLHDSRFQSEESLLACIKQGNPECGLEQIGEGKDTEGSDWILSVLERPDPRPVWIIIWGAPTDLAQALWKAEATYDAEQFAALKAKLRVYAVGDQYDESGPWIKSKHKDIFYITGRKVIRGIYRSGDQSLVSPEWLTENVCTGHGPLGEAYPIYDGGDIFSSRIGAVKGIKEGDTPSFLYLIQNGLSDPMHPDWGSWGGRFEGNGTQFFDGMDTCCGYTDEMASVYKWRKAFQQDFKARMDWCVMPCEKANHAPEAVIDQGNTLTVAPGQRVVLSANGSTDPDGDSLSYRWEFYRDPSNYKGDLEITDSDTVQASFTAPEVIFYPRTIHILLTVTDNGEPALSGYSRIVVTVDPSQ